MPKSSEGLDESNAGVRSR